MTGKGEWMVVQATSAKEKMNVMRSHASKAISKFRESVAYTTVGAMREVSVNSLRLQRMLDTWCCSFTISRTIIIRMCHKDLQVWGSTCILWQWAKHGKVYIENDGKKMNHQSHTPSRYYHIQNRSLSGSVFTRHCDDTSCTPRGNSWERVNMASSTRRFCHSPMVLCLDSTLL